jgi:ankyrin repeat protein
MIFATVRRDIMSRKLLSGAMLLSLLSGCATSGTQTLHGLIRSNQTAKAVQLISDGTIKDCDQKLNGRTALYEAALRNQTELMEILLRRGADPNRGGTRLTPMFAAARKRNLEALKILLAHNGDAKAQQSNLSLLDAAVTEIEPPGPVTDMLIAAGARPGPVPEIWGWQVYGGVYWALASYHERNGMSVQAASEYEKAADGYAKGSQKILNWAKRREFVQTPGGSLLFMLAVGEAGRLSGAALQGGNANAYVQLESARTQAASTLANKAPAEVGMHDAKVIISDPRIHPLQLPDLTARPAKSSSPQSKRRAVPPPLKEIIEGPMEFNESSIRQWSLILAMYSEFCADKAESLKRK